MRLWLALLSLSVCGGAQSLTLGGKGALRLSSDQLEYGDAESKRYLVGPMLDLQLPFHLGLEADALYTRLGDSYFEGHIAFPSNFARARVNSWQFPILLKYHLPL